MTYAVHPHMTEWQHEARRKAIELDERLAQMRQMQDLIFIKLGILCRNGKTQALLDEIQDAALAYGEAFTAVIDSAPIAQKAITRR
jgi:hypothetical protein